MFWRRFWAVVKARSKEYWGDSASLFFSFVVPPFLILVMSLVFTEDTQIFRIASLKDAITFSIPDYVATVQLDSIDAATNKVKHHQYDLFIAQDTYWVNPESAKGRAIEQLFIAELQQYKRVEVAGSAVRYVDWVIPGILGMNLMFSSFFGIGFVIVRYRKNGVLKRMRATPLTVAEFLSAQLFSRLIILLIVSASIFMVANAVLDLLVLGSYFNILIIAVLGNIAMLSMALIFASRIQSEELANTLLNAVTLPMLLLSEAWFPLDGAPQWVQAISQAFPLTHMVGAVRSIMLDGASLVDVASSIWYLLAISIVSIGLASRLFRWQ